MFVLQQANRKTVTPMQWSKEANAGFTKGTPWLQPNAGYITRNMDVSLGMGDLVVLVTALLSFYWFPVGGWGVVASHTRVGDFHLWCCVLAFTLMCHLCLADR